MTVSLDLKVLMARESEQVEWKENVADHEDVVATLSAFANDLANLGGGYVVCGAKEDRDQYGFPSVSASGLSSAELKKLEGLIMEGCRAGVSPPIVPLVQELPSESPDRRVLVFIMPATPFAHLFRRRKQAGQYFVRLSRETREARNGILRELLVRKGAVDPWDRRPCAAASVSDLDLLALRDALQRMRLFDEERGVEGYLSDTVSLSPFVPPLLSREPLTGILRPRNFTLLLFGRSPQAHAPGAFSYFSLYPGVDRSDSHAARHELAGTLLDQARRLIALLDAQSYLAFDKTDLVKPNALKYPQRALHEAMINALAHRDYELPDPTRVTAFADRIEFVSPGSLPLGVSLDELSQGRAAPRWRNQCLAWFLTRLELAQAEGQGISTILRTMRDEGCPPASFAATEGRVTCVLPAHPRHALEAILGYVEKLIGTSDLKQAQRIITGVVSQEPLNDRAVSLFAGIHSDLAEPGPVRAFAEQHQLDGLAPKTLLALSGALLTPALRSPEKSSREDVALGLRLSAESTRRGPAAGELRHITSDLAKSDLSAALEYLDGEFEKQPAFDDNAVLVQLRSTLLIKLATEAAERKEWAKCVKLLDWAKADLDNAESLNDDQALTSALEGNLMLVVALKKLAVMKLMTGWW